MKNEELRFVKRFVRHSEILHSSFLPEGRAHRQGKGMDAGQNWIKPQPERIKAFPAAAGKVAERSEVG